MSSQKRRNSSHSVRKRRGRKLVFSCFLLLFILSASMVLMNIMQKHKAEKSYSELWTLVSQEAFAAAKTERKPAETLETEWKPAEVFEKNADSSEPKTPVQKNSMSFSTLKEINPEIIGWLIAEGTNINYPVAHTDNNEYYLTHLYDGELNANGTLFVDYRNAFDFSDRNTVIYGHYMKSGAMFQSLAEYKDQEFYDANPRMVLYTPTGDYSIELISGTVEDGNYEFVKFNFSGEEEFNAYVNSFRKRSTFASDVELQPGDRIVSLCTCSYERKNARFMVIGRLVPIMERCE